MNAKAKMAFYSWFRMQSEIENHMKREHVNSQQIFYGNQTKHCQPMSLPIE